MKAKAKQRAKANDERNGRDSLKTAQDLLEQDLAELELGKAQNEQYRTYSAIRRATEVMAFIEALKSHKRAKAG